MLAAWLVLQWTGLALAALRVRLAAEYPEPAEFQAVRIMLAIQFGASAVLSPGLCRNWRITLVSLASGSVLLLLAGCVAGRTASQLLPAMALVSGWIVTLYLWRGAVPTPRGQAVFAALATTYGIGGALLCYFRLELNPDPASSIHCLFGPVAAAFDSPEAPSRLAWNCIAAGLAAGLIGRGISILLRRGAKGSGPP